MDTSGAEDARFRLVPDDGEEGFNSTILLNPKAGVWDGRMVAQRNGGAKKQATLQHANLAVF